MLHSLNPGGHNRYPHHPFQLFIKGRAENDGCIGIDFTADTVCCFIYLKQGHIHPACDIDKNRFCPFHRGVIQQRIIDSCFCCFNGACFARSFACSHHRLAHFRHHRPNIGKIQIDKARLYHQVSDPAYALMQYRICHMEGIGKGGTLIGQAEQVLVRDNNQCIDIGLKCLNAFICLFHSALAFEIERLCDNANGQDAALSGSFGNNRGCPCTCAAAHTCGNKDHIGICQLCQHIIQTFFCCLAADFRL